jgi:hypothetical protein
VKFKIAGTGWPARGRSCPHTNAKALQNATTAFELRNIEPQRISPATFRQTTAPPPTAKMSLVSGEKSNFQFILRLLNTNVREPLLDLDTRDERWNAKEEGTLIRTHSWRRWIKNME